MMNRAAFKMIVLLTSVVCCILPMVYTTPIMSYKFAYNMVNHNYKVVCYLGSWAVYRPGDGKYPVEEIDPFICTHLIYGFTGLGWDNKIRSLDSYYDLEENYGKGAFKRFTGLKKINPKLKTIIAIGGWNEGSVKYSNMAANSGTRKIFIDSCVEFCKKYDFDGLDLDWEYPASRGGKPEDRQNHALLLKEIHEEFAKHGLLLTAAVSAGKHTIDPGYDVAQMGRYLDIINLMAYDYHGGWETFTGHNAPLYARPDEVDTERYLNVNFSVNYWISQGAPPEKIVLGMGLYGRSFTLAKAENNTYKADAPSRGQAGPYTREPGSLGYNEICEFQMRDKWTIVREPYTMAPYAYNDRQWVGYDDEESIIIKANYAKTMRLGGGMVWSIETDDFHGRCHGKKYPLLTAINNVFASDEIKPLPVPKPDPSPGPTPQPPTTTVNPTTNQPITTPSTQPTWSPPTPSSTQPTPSTSPNPDTTTPSNLPCPGEGTYPNPTDCQKFYRCVNIGSGYVQYEYSCPDGTVFDKKTGNCSWPYLVPDCKNYFLNKYSYLWRYYPHSK